jgi:hypothetical protein
MNARTAKFALALALALSGQATLPVAARAGASYTLFSVNGGTIVNSVYLNDSGEVAGNYRDNSTGYGNVFIRSAGGIVSNADPNGSYPAGVSALNNAGTTLGGVGSSPYLRDTAGNVTTFTIPGATFDTTFARALNNNGDAAGDFQSSATSLETGFIRNASTGNITSFTVNNLNTEVTSINASGVTAGITSGFAFVRQSNGLFGTYTVGGANYYTTTLLDNANDLVINYVNQSNYGQTLLSLHGQFNSIDINPSASSYSVIVSAISNNGVVAGYYFDASGEHGFTYNPTLNAYMTYNAPGGVNGTALTSINDSGEVAGYYTGANYGQQYFVAETQAVPEPSTAVLAALAGAIGAGYAGLRQRAVRIHPAKGG